jgi:hypothetical protein
MKNLVKIIIPVYQENLEIDEVFSLMQCCTVLSKYQIVIVKPKSLNVGYIYQMFPQLTAKSFDDEYFKSVESYNRLMLSPEFYSQFLDSEYILIYQLDALVFRDELEMWCNKSFDYIGAPWIPRGLFLKKIRNAFLRLRGNDKRTFEKHIHYKVGNGGFSLRRVSAFYEITTNETDLIQSYLKPDMKNRKFIPEDVFWALEPKRKNYNFSVPDYNEALLFSFDKYPRECFKITHTIPFGCHAWNRKKTYPFWIKIIRLNA